MGLKALILFNKKHNNINMGQKIKELVKKIIAVNLVLVLLFNISSEVFGALVLPQNEISSEEIRSVLEEVYLAQGNNNYKECVNKNSDKACQNAFISLEGLSYLEGTKDAITKVERFIESNEEGLAAGDSLINGSAVLLRWKAYQNIKRYIKKRFVKENNNGGKGIGGFGGYRKI